MSRFAERYRRGDTLPAPLDWLLTPASWVQLAGMRWRHAAIPTRVDGRVISFGNITAGGVGKTPAVIERAALEREVGHNVAVLTRGYGSPSTRTPVILRVEDPASADWPGLAARFGDEPVLIARRVPGVVVVKCADRVAGARAALAEGCDTLILDDGYQSVALARDENILLIDASAPFGNGRIVPRGLLREPLEAMARATHIVLTHCGHARDLDGLRAKIGRFAPDTPIRCTLHAPSHLWRLSDGERFPLDWLHGREVTAACAIGQPERFFHTLEALGAMVSRRVVARDHAHLREDALGGDLPVILTEKDAVRTRPGENRYALAINLMDWQPGGGIASNR